MPAPPVFSLSLKIALLCFGLLCCRTAAEEGMHVLFSVDAPSAEAGVFYPILLDEEFLLLPFKEGPISGVARISLKTGRVVWKWEDKEGLLKNNYYLGVPYVHEQVVVFANGKHIFALGAQQGRLLWAQTELYPGGSSYVNGCGAWFCRAYNDRKKGVSKVVFYDIRTGEELTRFEKKSPRPEVILDFRTPSVYISGKEDTLLAMGYAEYIPGGLTDSYLALWPYRDTSFRHMIPVFKSDSSGHTISENGLLRGRTSFWRAAGKLMKVDLEEKVLLWEKEFPREMLTSRLLWQDGMIYYAGEDAFLYAVDGEKGQVLWKAPISGTPGKVHACNGLLFLVGGSDGFLYVVNKENGEVVKTWQPKTGHGPDEYGLSRMSWAGDDRLLVLYNGKWYLMNVPNANAFPDSLPLP